MPELMFCGHCGKKVSSEAIRKVAGSLVCPNCVDIVKRASETARLAAEESKRRESEQAKTQETISRAFFSGSLGVVGWIGVIFLLVVAGGLYCAFRDPDFRRGLEKGSESYRQPSKTIEFAGQQITFALPVNGPAVVPPPIFPGGRQGEENTGPLPGMALGNWGRVDTISVLQVLGRGCVLTNSAMYLGWSTTGVVDGASMKINDCVAVVGTAAYTTTAGASRTVFLVVPKRIADRGASPEEVALWTSR